MNTPDGLKNTSRIVKPAPKMLAFIKEHFAYDPQTGAIRVLKEHAGRKPGTKVGTRIYQTNGKPKHLHFWLGGRYIKNHHVAWFLLNGWWPTRIVDHIFGNPFDNREHNLRHATHQENAWNRATSSRNRLGVKGISVRRTKNKGNRFVVTFDGKQKTFATLDRAKQYYNECAIEARGEYAYVHK